MTRARGLGSRDEFGQKIGRGLDSADKSTRDVFNDVSKYIGTISNSLDRLFP